MTANERYEHAWNLFLMLLNKDSKSRLTPFLKQNNIHVRGMQKWMSDKGLSVRSAKLQIRILQKEAWIQSPTVGSESTGKMFLKVEPSGSEPSNQMQDLLSGISFTFPDGTQVSIKSGSARAVMSFMKLYQKEEALCLE